MCLLPNRVAQQRALLGQLGDRGWLGVRIQEVTDDIAESLGLPNNQGALVASVTEKGPAQAAGLEPGDVILELNGQKVSSMRSLPCRTTSVT